MKQKEIYKKEPVYLGCNALLYVRPEVDDFLPQMSAELQSGKSRVRVTAVRRSIELRLTHTRNTRRVIMIDSHSTIPVFDFIIASLSSLSSSFTIHNRHLFVMDPLETLLHVFQRDNRLVIAVVSPRRRFRWSRQHR